MLRSEIQSNANLNRHSTAMVLWAIWVWKRCVRVHKKLVPCEVVEKEHLLGALEGVVGPSLPWVISNGPIQIVELEDTKVNVELVLGLMLLIKSAGIHNSKGEITDSVGKYWFPNPQQHCNLIILLHQ